MGRAIASRHYTVAAKANQEHHILCVDLAKDVSFPSMPSAVRSTLSSEIMKLCLAMLVDPDTLGNSTGRENPGLVTIALYRTDRRTGADSDTCGCGFGFGLKSPKPVYSSHSTMLGLFLDESEAIQPGP
ncbi:hypothetical protein JHW43_003296 [Diplocarpon mali]|nr:hypothetical protein JHW43_003296 [Diplocarpon mali]